MQGFSIIGLTDDDRIWLWLLEEITFQSNCNKEIFPLFD